MEHFYTTHAPDHTDSFLLFIKAVMLFGLVTDMNTDIQLRSELKPETFSPLRCVGIGASQNIVLTTGRRDQSFLALDKLVAVDFLDRLPFEYKRYLQHMSESPIDTDLYMVHLIPHA